MLFRSAANAKSILFGDFREAYVIRDASDVALLRLTERYADYFQVGFVAFQRSDGTMQNAGAVKAWKHSNTGVVGVARLLRWPGRPTCPA